MNTERVRVVCETGAGGERLRCESGCVRSGRLGWRRFRCRRTYSLRRCSELCGKRPPTRDCGRCGGGNQQRGRQFEAHIVATESGILHRVGKAAPEKVFIPAPPELDPELVMEESL